MPRDRPTDSGVPKEFAQATPRDLYDTSDIRIVMIELGKQMGKLEALDGGLQRITAQIDKIAEKVDSLEHKVTFVKGAIWVIGPVLVVLVALLGWYFTGKLSVTVSP